ncbi:hypothetical protein [Hyalangium versicolor]|uniref:hypothetical protein n=1 Tax=Hyalangium versicolor TaxID=2861190 RepID=UPI001CCAF750|nr:hypothetical protein [Hyalangium versicolor]
MRLSREHFLAERELPARESLPVAEEQGTGPVLWLRLLVALARALVLLFMPLIAFGLGVVVGRRFDNAWAMLGTVAVCFVAGGILAPGEPL